MVLNKKKPKIVAVTYFWSEPTKKFVEQVTYSDGDVAEEYIKSPTRRVKDMLWTGRRRR